jgi:hypothetical protein
MSNFQSKCMYCGSTSYGSGCIFSSHRMHIHVDDPTKCIYCGMMAYGSGCIFNPFTRMHVHGMDVGQTIKETVRKTVELSYITDRLLENNKNTEAYKLGLIDIKGNLLRVPETVHEQRLISPLSRLLFKLKTYIPVSAEMLTESLKLIPSLSESVEEFESKIELEYELKPLISQIKEIIKKASNKISHERIEEAIETAILDTIVK